MNHTQRIAETARRHRHLSRRMAKEAIETYLELLAEETVEGDWVDIYGIGKISVTVEPHNSGNNLFEGTRNPHPLKRLRTKVRLSREFKKSCYTLQKCVQDYPGEDS